MENNNNCLAKILNVINILQNNAEKTECQDNSCTKPFLGPNTNILCFNTRPVTLYRCDNSLVTLNYTNANNEELTTTIFRVENVNNDSVGVLLLEQTIDEEGNITYLNTNTYATINLKCICALRCLNDVIVDNV